MKERWSGRSKYDFFNDIISHTDINSWQIEQQIDPLQLLLLNFPQVALGVQADLVLLYLAVQTGNQCLNQYTKVEAKYGEFNPWKLSRQELVCDMEDLRKISATVLATINKKYQ